MCMSGEDGLTDILDMRKQFQTDLASRTETAWKLSGRWVKPWAAGGLSFQGGGTGEEVPECFQRYTGVLSGVDLASRSRFDS
ncbi:hypothetical protein N7523_006918 [Penicillium sp. IBT 18751x]|nr:hypothetical protein N7523_006918 [Penicillium sp. IBT 18751x]